MRDSLFEVTEHSGESGYAFGDDADETVEVSEIDARTVVYLEDAPNAEIDDTTFSGWATAVTLKNPTQSPDVTIQDSTFDENRNGIGTDSEGATLGLPTIKNNVFRNTEAGCISNRTGLDGQADLIDQNDFEADDESFSGEDIPKCFDPTPEVVDDPDEGFIVPTSTPGCPDPFSSRSTYSRNARSLTPDTFKLSAFARQ